MGASVLRHLKISATTATPDHLQIARQIEQCIRTGTLKEGERLPPTTDLVRLWGVNITRIQRAMDLLTNQGLLQRFPRRGTFVAPQAVRPSVGILVGVDLLLEQSQFDRVLATTLKHEIKNLGFTPRIYDAMTSPDSDEGRSSRADLDYDLRHHRFNGFVATSGQMREMLVELIGPNQPMAMFGAPNPGVDAHIDFPHFLTTSVRWLAEAGCKRIVYLHNADAKGWQARTFRKALEAEGLSVLPESLVDLQRLAFQHTEVRALDRFAYQGMLQTLAAWKRDQFVPDGFVISDDIAARGVAVAILEALARGKVFPRTVVLTTEGINRFYAIPMARYLLPPSAIAQELVSRVVARALGEAVSETPTAIRGALSDGFR